MCWGWPEGEKGGLGAGGRILGSWGQAGVLGGALCWGLFSHTLLCDIGEVTASLWAHSLRSEGLKMGLLSPILDAL